MLAELQHEESELIVREIFQTVHRIGAHLGVHEPTIQQLQGLGMVSICVKCESKDKMYIWLIDIVDWATTTAHMLR